MGHSCPARQAQNRTDGPRRRFCVYARPATSILSLPRSSASRRTITGTSGKKRIAPISTARLRASGLSCPQPLHPHRPPPDETHLWNGNAASRCGFATVMKLLGHSDPGMTMRYVDVTSTDLQREFQLARSNPRYLLPQPKASSPQLRAGLDGVIDSFLAAQHVLEMFRRPLPKATSRSCLD